MYKKTLLLYLFAVILLILGFYSLFYLKDTFSGILWSVFGIIFLIIGYGKLQR
jgi:membrane-bound ClpP family serine protease